MVVKPGPESPLRVWPGWNYVPSGNAQRFSYLHRRIERARREIQCDIDGRWSDYFFNEDRVRWRNLY